MFRAGGDGALASHALSELSGCEMNRVEEPKKKSGPKPALF
jgi:hypothetical protein